MDLLETKANPVLHDSHMTHTRAAAVVHYPGNVLHLLSKVPPSPSALLFLRTRPSPTFIGAVQIHHAVR